MSQLLNELIKLEERYYNEMMELLKQNAKDINDKQWGIIDTISKVREDLNKLIDKEKIRKSKQYRKSANSLDMEVML